MQNWEGRLGFLDVQAFSLKLKGIRKKCKWLNSLWFIPHHKYLVHSINVLINDSLNLLWQHALHAFKECCLKMYPAPNEEFMATPFSSNNVLKVKEHVNIYYNERLENGVHSISHWVNGNGSFLTFVEFGTKYTISAKVITYFKYVRRLKNCY